MNDVEQKLKFIALRAQGKALTTIAPMLGVSRQTLANWEDELMEEIQNRKAMELDALREAYFMTTQAKIEELGEMCRRIREELKTRDFSGVPTATLLKLDVEYHARLEAEFPTHRVKSTPELVSEKGERETNRIRFRSEPSSQSPPLLLDPDERGNGKRRRGQTDAN
ncbi:MAG: helix-turn-helix domain-containing protein [Halobacteriota archaeon]